MNWADLIYLAIVCGAALLGLTVASIYGGWLLLEAFGKVRSAYRWLRSQLVPGSEPRLVDAEAEGWLPDDWTFPRRERERASTEFRGAA